MPRAVRLAGVVACAAALVRCASTTAPSCTYAVSPTSLSMSGAGGGATLSVATGSSCSWTVVSNATWIMILPNLPPGNQTVVSLLVLPNGPTQRTGTVTVAGQTITIAQSVSAVLPM